MYDNNAEAIVLATLVYHPDYVLSSDKLLPEYFHNTFNQAIYWAIRELYKEKITRIDFSCLEAKIKENPIYVDFTLDKRNCDDFIYMAKDSARNTLEEYKLFVNQIVTATYRMETYRRTASIQQICLKQDSAIQDVQEKFRNMIMELTEKFTVNEEDKLFGEVIQDMWEESKRRANANNNKCGIPSKFNKLNDYVTYESSELVVVCAKRKEGKSAFAMTEALDKLEHGHRVLYMDTELRSSQFMQRIVSNKAKVDNKNLKNNYLSEEDKRRVDDTIEWFRSSNNFVHIYRPRWTTEMIYSAVLYWKQKLNIDFVVYDYMKSSGAVGASEVYNDLGNLTNFLKNDIAGGFDIPVLSCAQLNRANDIADSYKIEQYASTILDLRRKNENEIESDNQLGLGDLGNYKLFVKANRNGESMEDISKNYIDLKFQGIYYDFTGINKSPIEHSHNPYE